MSVAPQFRKAVAPVYYHRKREDVLTELPELIERKEWEEQPAENKSVYQGFDEFLEKENILENDTDVFYGGAFQEFHKQQQGIEEDSKEEEPVDYTKFSMKERVELLPPPTDNTMEEFEQYKVRMGYNQEKLKSVRYRMSVYDDFLKEYDQRKKIKGMGRPAQKQKTVKKNRDYSRQILQLLKTICLDKKMKAQYIIKVQKRTVQNERRCVCEKLFCTLC